MIRTLALLFGISNLAAAIGGFIPGITQPIPAGSPELVMSAAYGLLLGIYAINALHNLIHLGFGVGGVLAWRSAEASRRYWQIAGVILLLLTILGIVPATSTLGGLVPLYGHDIWLHGLEVLLAFYLGFFFGRTRVPAPSIPATGS